MVLKLVIGAIAVIAFFGLGGVNAVSSLFSNSGINKGSITDLFNFGKDEDLGRDASHGDPIDPIELQKLNRQKIITNTEDRARSILLGSESNQDRVSRLTSQGFSLNEIARAEKRDQDRKIQELKSNNFQTSIASAGLSQTELNDIILLDARRNKSAGTLKFKKKRNGLDTVALKRIEEDRAARTLGLDNFSSRIRGKEGRAKLFANPNFDLGLPNNATQADRDRAIKQQREHSAQLAKAEQNRINAENQRRIGAEIEKTVGTTAKQQKTALRAKGINLQGGALNARALAKLRERGLI